jgi:mannonate dehydratase
MPTRRDFALSALAGAAAPAATKKPLEPLSPGIKISLQVPTNPSDDDLMFAKQLGVEWVNIPSGGANATGETFVQWKARVQANGMRVWNIGNSNVHNMEQVTLNLPGCDQKVEEYKQFLRNLAKAGLTYTTYAHMANGIWSSERSITRGNASARRYLRTTAKGVWGGKTFDGEITHGRRFSKEEIWENYTYFIRQVVPVAEELGIRIGIHPDDPPETEIAGVPRCIFSTYDGYMRALEIADSPNVGVCFCVGTWLEGGKLMGREVNDALRGFARIDKLWKVHFRNVTAPVPDFTETFIDNGYGDLARVMRTLVDVDFRGNLIADHVPTMVGGRNVAWAYSIGYIKALYKMAGDAQPRSRRQLA